MQNTRWTKLSGNSGSGKSTLAKLVCFALNGIPYKPSKEEESIHNKYLLIYRDLVERYQGQPAIFVSSTFKPNCFFDPNKICFADKLNLLEIGEYKVEFSQGERQRFVFLEALSKQSSLMILDECFSGIPQQHEYDILKWLKDKIKLKNCIYISHRKAFEVENLMDTEVRL